MSADFDPLSPVAKTELKIGFKRNNLKYLKRNTTIKPTLFNYEDRKFWIFSAIRQKTSSKLTISDRVKEQLQCLQKR